MLDSMLLSEVIAEQKKRLIDEAIARRHLSDIAGTTGAGGAGVRGAIAAAIVRFGIFLDGTAGRRAAAVHG
jgi:hypothetical protein